VARPTAAKPHTWNSDLMPSFVSRFLGRLSVGRKLLLIYLLDLTPSSLSRAS